MRVTFIVNTLFSGKGGRSKHFVKFLTTNFGLGRVSKMLIILYTFLYVCKQFKLKSTVALRHSVFYGIIKVR